MNLAYKYKRENLVNHMAHNVLRKEKYVFKEVPLFFIIYNFSSKEPNKRI